MKFTAQDGKKAFWGLVIIEICLLLIFAVDISFGHIKGIHSMFALDGEANIPAWFSSSQLLVIGILFLIVSRQFKINKIHRPSYLFLLLVAVGFVFLSLDECVGIHERAAEQLKNVEWMPRFTGNHGVWMPVYLAGILAFCIVAFPQIYAMWKNYKRETLILAAGVGLFLMGAVGLEIISYEFLRGPVKTFIYDMEVGLEEFLEMFGGSVIFYGTFLLSLRHDLEQT